MSSILFSLFCYYSIFCISTAITAHFTIYKPIIKETLARDLGEDIDEVVSGGVYAISLFVFTLIGAPAMVKVALTGPDQEFIDDFIENIASKFDE